SPVLKRRLQEPWDIPLTAHKLFKTWRGGGVTAVMERLLRKWQHEEPQLGYREWHRRFAAISEADRAAIRARVAGLDRRPLFSVLMPVHETPPEWLSRAIG